MSIEHTVSPFEGNNNNNNNDNASQERLSFPSSAMSISKQRQSQQLSVPDLTEQMKIPITQDEADVVDAALADEMNKLNMTDYDKINFEVYGINEDIDENQSRFFLRQKFIELEYELEKQVQNRSMLIGGLKAGRKAAKNKNRFSKKTSSKETTTTNMKYEFQKYPEYVNTKQFHLAFLRSARFDTKLAAEKIIRHFTQKQDLFGSNNSDVMGRDVKLSDLSKADKIVLESGMVQILPVRDTGGRFIFVLRPDIYPKVVKENGPQITVKNMVRAWFYIWSVYGFQNEEFQKKGMVIIIYIVGMTTNMLCLPLAKEICIRRDALPNKVVAIHICYDKQKLRPWMAAHSLYSLSKRNRVRLRKHYGDHGEVIFKLQTYGIPVNETDHFPKNGSVPLKLHYEWLMTQKYHEEQEQEVQTQVQDVQNVQSHSLNLPDVSSSNFTVDIDIIDEADLSEILLLGDEQVNTIDIVNKNKNNSNNPVISNSNIVELVEADNNKHEDEASKFAKTDISERIISMIHDDYKGKFLKLNPKHNHWEEVDRTTAREKISHYFRQRRKIKTTTNNNAKNNTATTSTATTATSTAASMISSVASPSSITSSSIKRDVPFPSFSSSLLSNTTPTTTTTTMMNDGSMTNSEQPPTHSNEEQRFWKRSRA
ncbi:hypothetical protein FRACYDRAFT_241459 [Fragilariopsis cylindrus CCMP1102]|uniref:DUF6824 domain-containing protein n=1 Tax=Fragilariopsis cylindrus CCMP1102 TaxID=635003 RepID=A0A1E7F9Q4_9STRA|nr:hypothetical protein FRACYDRAFT_241459 [Fragilariopsis cylindrus CCMP1102]|eukprot:OEU14902.1 hypothetical protein FRACYDRAFT_241459 [Fragilariopsis cylindrus CCMP1102]